MRFVAAWLALSAVVACHAEHPRRSIPGTVITSCAYELALQQSGVAHVDVTCRAAGPMSFRAAHAFVGRSVSGLPKPKRGRWQARAGKLSYAVDVAKLAGRAKSVDRARRVGASFSAPLSSVLLVPEPLTTEIPVTVHVTTEPGVSAAVGLARADAPDTYRLMAHEIPVATYFAFGKLEQRELDVGGARLDVTRLDGALDQSSQELERWIRVSAGAVRDFYGAFPVPRASISVVPVPDARGVLFGKVLPESEPGVVLLLGQHATRKALYSDWILVHELFHLGVPSFFEEGKWLDEGLATYYEPIIRVRAGLYTETELWSEFSSEMPRGLPAFTEGGLEKARDASGIYWGGAIACLVADVRARKRHLGTGLEVGLVALRNAGGRANEVWALADVVRVIDETLGTPTLAPIVRAHAQDGHSFDLAKLFAELGVNRDPRGGVQLSDSAPLAAVRRSMTAKP